MSTEKMLTVNSLLFGMVSFMMAQKTKLENTPSLSTISKRYQFNQARLQRMSWLLLHFKIWMGLAVRMA